MSQLYQLFCEGLRSRSTIGLSSTLTSTPLENENEYVDDFVPSPAQPVPPLVQESPGSSVQGQVGSSNSPHSPPAPTGTDSPARSSCEGEVSSSRSKPAWNQRNQGHPNSPDASQPSRVPGSSVGVSQADPIDKLNAFKRRDEVLKIRVGNGRRGKEGEQCNGNQKDRCRTSDSSETDFEGAEEYFKKNAAGSSCMALKVDEKRSTVPRSRHSSDSDISLALRSSSSTSSLNATDIEDSHQQASAARCRVFEHNWIKMKTAEHQLLCDARDDQLAGVPSKESQVYQNIITENKSQQNTDETNMTSILKGVVAYVEVRSGHDNRSMGVKAQMRNLGATVMDKLMKEVTHVVFNEGAPSTLTRAQTLNCHLVSVLWIDACKKGKDIANEQDYPPLNMHLYEQGQVSKRIKYRKLKSMQPDFDEGKGKERLDKYVKKFRRQALRAVASQQNTELGSEDETPFNLSTAKQTCQEPVGIKLKRLSVVLQRIDAQDVRSMTVSAEKRNKRRLLPLRQEVPLSLSVEDLNGPEFTQPDFPYNLANSSKQKSTPVPRRLVKQKLSATQSFRRRSSCFKRGTQSLPQSQSKPGKKMRTMVCTFMHRRDIDVVAAVIKQLGGWILEPTVSARTSHVICGDSKRTINLLRGIAYGCWILHQEWVMRSLEAGRWLVEEPFELTMFPAIQQCRVARETLGVQSEIFCSAGPVYVARNTTPPRSDLLDLLEICGAKVVKTARQAKIVVGRLERRPSHLGVAVVKECWILDSIQENMLLPLRQYCL